MEQLDYSSLKQQMIDQAAEKLFFDVVQHSVLPRYLWNSHLEPLAYSLAKRLYD